MPRPHRIFPGYPVAAVATIAYFATAPGQTFIASQLNGPLRAGFGLSELQLNSTYTIATVAAAFPLVLTGSLADRLGPRRTLAIVALAFSLGCCVMASAQGLLTVFLGFFCLRFFGQGSLSLVSAHAVAMWFHRRLGSVNGVKIVVVFALWAFLPQLALALIERLGWRQTYLIFAVAIAVLVIPLSLIFVRNRPEDLGLRTDNDPPDAPRSARAPLPEPEPSFTLKQSRATPAYWILALTSVLPGFVGTAILFDMTPIMAEHALTAAHGAAAISAWTITMSVMAIPAGIITDRAHPALIIPTSMLLGGIAAAALIPAATPTHAAAAMVGLGFAQSLGASCAAATVARYFGRLHHGAIRSSLTRLAVIGTGLGPIATALSHHLTGSYTPALWAFAAISLAAALTAAMLRKPHTPGLESP